MQRRTSIDPKCLKGNLVKNLTDYDSFFEKGEPRKLSDWNPEHQINAVLLQLMIATGVERIDEILVPGILHLKLRFGLKYLLDFLYNTIIEIVFFNRSKLQQII